MKINTMKRLYTDPGGENGRLSGQQRHDENGDDLWEAGRYIDGMREMVSVITARLPSLTNATP
jgi:hypothetical protein